MGSTRLYAFFLVVAVGAALSAEWSLAPAYQTGDGREVLQLPALGGPATLTQDRTSARKLAAIRDYIGTASWTEVTRALQNLLDAREDGFLRVEDTDGEGKPVVRWTSARGEADRLLGTLPPAGREVYRLRNDPAARSLFNEAKARNDLAAITDLVSRFRYTTAGHEALNYLALQQLDRGNADLAALCFRRLLSDAQLERTPALLFRASLAFQAAGDSVEAERLWSNLATRTKGNLRLGPREMTMKDARAEFERWGRTSESSNWTLFRGNSRRQAMAVGGEPFLEPRWQRPLTNSPIVRAWRADAPADLLPVGSPIASAGRLYYRSYAGLHAVDLDTGHEAWHCPSPLALDNALAEPGRKVQLVDWQRVHKTQNLACLPFVNSTTNTLTNDGQRLLEIEDLPLPPPIPYMQQILAGEKRFLGPLKTFAQHNRLRALDLGTGAVLWEAGRAATPGKAPQPLEDAYFLGPPLPLAGGLFVLVDQKKEIRLVCLEPGSGKLRWSQPLVQAADTALLDLRRRLCAAHLAYGEGVLVCPTGAGSVLAFDPLTRNLLWAHNYRAAVAEPGGYSVDPAGLISSVWQGAAPLIHDGCVVLAAPDSPAVECIRLRDGKLLWTAQREAEDLYVGCVADDRVLIVGRSTCRALKLSTGEVLWHHETGAPSGLGLRTGKIYYLPLQAGSILALDLGDPRHSAPLECRSGGAPGNLICQDGQLISQSALILTAYPQVGAWKAQLEEQLARSPSDPKARYERGRLRLDAGDYRGAMEDLRVALERASPVKTAAQAVFFRALTQWLQRDFTASERYLSEYRALCTMLIPDDATPRVRQEMAAEAQRRLENYYQIVARGRAAQGRSADAFGAYLEMAKLPPSGFLRAEDPAVRLRSDLFAIREMARLWPRLRPGDQATLRTAIEQQLSSCEDGRFIDLLTALPGAHAAEVESLEKTARNCNRADVLPLLFHLVSLEQQSREPIVAARLLLIRCRLLTRHGLLEDAAAGYRQLGTIHGKVILPDGRSGAEHLAEVQIDRRFLAVFDPPRLAPTSGRWVSSQHKGDFSSRSGEIWSDYEDPTDEGNIAPSTQMRRMFLDLNTGNLTVTGLDGRQGWTVWLPQVDCPRNVKQWTGYRIIDHLAVVQTGPMLSGVDLIDHRVRWSRNLLDDLPLARPTENLRNVLMGLGLDVVAGEPERVVQRAGLIGPSSLRSLIIQTAQGLTSVDPVTGQARWQRTHKGVFLLISGDSTRLCLADTNGDSPDGNYAINALRMISQADGAQIDTGNPRDIATPFVSRRTIGTSFLIQDTETKGDFILRLYDPLTGQDVWRKKCPESTRFVDAPWARHLAGVISSRGVLSVFDLKEGRELAQLQVNASDMSNVESVTLLVDADHYYVVVQKAADPQIGNINPYIGSGSDVIVVHGPVYAFHRATGRYHWVATVKNQMLLSGLGADKCPLLLCASQISRPSATPAAPPKVVNWIALQAIDKNTGKLTMDPSEQVQKPFQDIFHTLRIDPVAGTVDLIAGNWIWRHTLSR